MPRISEADLIIPALNAMNTSPNGTISTTDLISTLTNSMNPTGEDLDILENRNDTKFSQKVRNLKSHSKTNTMINSGLATHTNGNFTITSAGQAYLAGS